MYRSGRLRFNRRSCEKAAARAFFSASIFLLAGCSPTRGTIGALLAQTPDRRVVVRETPDGLAADREGIRPDDEILLIDGRDARAMSPEQIHAALGGDVGEPVKLTVVRGDTVLRVTLRRTPARRLRGAGAASADAAGPAAPENTE